MKKYGVHYTTCEEIYGIPEERSGVVGPYDTEDKAYEVMQIMDNERWISGQHVYYNTYVSEVEV